MSFLFSVADMRLASLSDLLVYLRDGRDRALHQRIEIRRRSGVNEDLFSRTRMSEAKTHGMQGHAINAAFCSLLGRIFSVTDDRMTQRGELHAYLVL